MKLPQNIFDRAASGGRVTRLVRCSSFAAPVLVESFKEHFHLVMAVEKRSKILDEVLLTVSNRQKSGNLCDVRLHVFLGVFFKELVHFVVIGVLADSFRKRRAFALQFAGKPVNQRLVNELVRPTSDPAWLVLGLVKSITVKIQQFLVKFVRERLLPLVWDRQQNRIHGAQILPGGSKGQNQLQTKLFVLLGSAAESQKECDLVKVEPVKLRWIAAALQPLTNLGFNPKLAKLPKLVFMLRDLFSKMGVSDSEKLGHIAGIRQQIDTLVGDWYDSPPERPR
jgi:hypothetical protein